MKTLRSNKIAFGPNAVVGGSVLKASALALMIAFPVIAFAGTKNTVEKVEVSKVGADTVVQFSMQEKLDVAPKNFKLANATKIVLDFDNVSNATGLTKKESAEPALDNIMLVEARGKTRAVLNLKAASEYETRVEGKSLFVTVRGAAVKAQNDSAKAVDASSQGSHSVKAIDFRRGANGEGKIIIDTADASGIVDIKTQGQNLVLEFIGASIPDALRKKFNVVDFGTPVQMITATAQGSKTRMVVEPKGSWEYSAYQVDTRFIVEVRRPKVEAATAAASAYKGEKLSFNFQNVEVRRALDIIGDFTKLNMVASDTVQGSLTLRLENVPWDQALDVVLQAKNLDMRRTGDVIMIAPREEIAKREKDIADAADNEPLKAESFQLNYTSTSEMLAVITNDKQRILSKRGSAVVDPRTNQIFVQDIPERLAAVAKIIKKIDVAMRQVQIEARIVEASDKFSQNIGARLGFNSATPYKIGGGNVLPGGSLTASGYQTGQIKDVPDFSESLGVNLPATNSTGSAAGKFSMVLFNNAATRFLNLELSALEADGRGKIISSPRVVTADQEVALIEQGVELPYQEASSSGAATIAFKKANLKLEVKPHITPDGNIIMSVEINKDAPGAATTSGIAIDTKHIKAKVMIENGGTVVIGGIYTQDERTDVNKVPFLGDLPVAGALFRNKVKQDTKTELLFFLTPRILDDSLGNIK
jgi:type IV pilus assembly protein PilQ